MGVLEQAIENRRDSIAGNQRSRPYVLYFQSVANFPSWTSAAASRCRLTGGQPTGFGCPRQSAPAKPSVQGVCRPRCPDALHKLCSLRARRNDGRLTRSSLRGSLLLMLDVPKCQVNAWLSDVWLFWDLVLKVFLGFSCHDQQAPVGQPFCKGNSAILPFETK